MYRSLICLGSKILLSEIRGRCAYFMFKFFGLWRLHSGSGLRMWTLAILPFRYFLSHIQVPSSFQYLANESTVSLAFAGERRVLTRLGPGFARVQPLHAARICCPLCRCSTSHFEALFEPKCILSPQRYISYLQRRGKFLDLATLGSASYPGK